MRTTISLPSNYWVLANLQDLAWYTVLFLIWGCCLKCVMKYKSSYKRPKLTFLRPKNDVKDGQYYDYLFKPRDQALSIWFDLSVIHTVEEIDSYAVDSEELLLVYFNLSVDSVFFSKRLVNAIQNYSGPKFALLNSDPFSHDRSQTKALIELIKFDALVISDVVLINYIQYQNVPIFYWPWSIDPQNFKMTENREGLFVSSRNSRPLYYKWRMSVGRHVESLFKKKNEAVSVTWDEYQRVISQSVAGYTCGSVTNTIVNKHLEIPASGACLITETMLFLETEKTLICL